MEQPNKDSWWDNFGEDSDGPGGACLWSVIAVVIMVCVGLVVLWRHHG